MKKQVRRRRRRVGRVSRDALPGRSIRILVDKNETLRIRDRFKEPHDGPGSLIATFVDSASLYRILDGEELRRIARTGKIIGGMFSVKAEREHGASWGENISEVISWGNRARGNRLGSDLFLAKVDVQNKKFFHMNPKVDFDSRAPESQLYSMDFSRCNVGLGCSVVGVTLDEVSFFEVNEAGDIRPISDTEIKEYVTRGRYKAIELRKISSVYHHGTIHGVDVYVVQVNDDSAYRKTWSVISRDETPIVTGAKSEKIAIDRAAKLLRYGHHGQPTLDLLPKSVMTEWRRRQRHAFLGRL